MGTKILFRGNCRCQVAAAPDPIHSHGLEMSKGPRSSEVYDALSCILLLFRPYKSIIS